MTKSHPYFVPGFFSMLPGVFHADPGLPIPFYFANRAQIEYSIWYPPEEAHEVAEEIEEYVLSAWRLDPWLREHPPRFEWVNNWPPMSTPWEHPLVQTMVRAHEAARGEDPAAEPEHPVNFGAASDGSFLEREGIPASFSAREHPARPLQGREREPGRVVASARSLAACVVEWCGVAA